MDLLRSLIKCLFCDYSPDEYVSQLLEKDPTEPQKGFCKSKEFVKELLHNRERQYNDEAIEGILQIADNIWLHHDGKPSSLSYGSFNALRYFSSQTFNADEKLVKFDHLLQWRDLSLYLGEDFLICMSLSKREVTDFQWATPNRHDYGALNDKLDKGLHDLHVHLDGGIETAELSWIRLMNNPTLITEELNQKFKESEKEALHRFWGIKNARTLKQWILVAGYIRRSIYNHLHDTINWDKCKKDILDACDTDSPEADNQILGEETGFGTIKQEVDNPVNEPIDYARLACEENSSYSYQAGERWIMHSVLKWFYATDNVANDMADWFYLYMLIKIRFRKECVQMNMRIGLNNYNQYYSKFKIEETIIADVKKKLAYLCNTSLRSEQDSIEVRGSVKCLKHTTKQYNKNTRLIGSLYKRTLQNRTSIEEIRAELQSNADVYVESLKQNQKQIHNELNERNDRINPIVALDTTGSDLSAHPDIIAPYLRYVKEKSGLENFSYHIAEDFMDVVDGLRALDELVCFVDNAFKLRLAHATALAVDINKFYAERKRNVLCTKQCLLDNLVWLFYMNKDGDQNVLGRIDGKARDLFSDIYPGETYDIEEYRKSMLLRGDMHDDTLMPGVSENVLRCQSQESIEARKSTRAKELWEKYRQKNESGSDIILYRMLDDFLPLVTKAQSILYDKVKQKGLAIESCPTSNLMIGPFGKYNEVPTFKFKEKDIDVSVNTDTKGIFATSLYVEYSLLACSMKKEGKTEEEILRMTDQLLANNSSQRFDIPKLDRLIEQV